MAQFNPTDPRHQREQQRAAAKRSVEEYSLPFPPYSLGDPVTIFVVDLSCFTLHSPFPINDTYNSVIVFYL